jgi:hypothetical protein
VWKKERKKERKKEKKHTSCVRCRVPLPLDHPPTVSFDPTRCQAMKGPQKIDNKVLEGYPVFEKTEDRKTKQK